MKGSELDTEILTGIAFPAEGIANAKTSRQEHSLLLRGTTLRLEWLTQRKQKIKNEVTEVTGAGGEVQNI